MNILAFGITVGITILVPSVFFIIIQMMRRRTRRMRKTVDDGIPTDASTTHGLSKKMKHILDRLDENAIPELIKYNGYDLFEAIDVDRRGILSIKEICRALNGNVEQLDDITSYHRKDSKPLLLKEVPEDESFEENKNETSTSDSRVGQYSKMLRSFLSQSSFYVEKRKRAKYVTKDELAKIIKMIQKKLENRHPIDIQFKNVFLYVIEKGGREKIVVNDVTGHLQNGSLNVIMGESGAGKTSLLETIGGRALHGRVEGEIYINGILRQIEHFSDHIGFVPKDDIMHAELTIKENFLFTGKLTLPRGTSIHDILALTSDVISDLGLERVENSIVGDISRRGVSGGEKKRVNIGLELMRKPSVLFLDEPTSGLDASSAMSVMHSLSKLARNQGMTVCATIHQPRKQIFDMFDSLILLGVGGKLIYHGEVSGSQMTNYFNALGYKNINNDPLADWMIDISSGYLAPLNFESHHSKKSAKENRDR
jgi:ABC-type multidrug transport system ATPase subunit